MALTLTVRSGRTVPKITFDSPKIMLGRSLGCDLVLPDPSVSQRHASIRQRGSNYIVIDEGSTNGTFVGPVRLSEGTPRVLKTGDLLRAGRVWVEVTLEQAAPTKNTKDATKEIALQLIEGSLLLDGEDDAHPKVSVTLGPSAGETLLLHRFNAPYVVGRGKRCELQLDDEDCSRRHLEIWRRGGRVFLRDLGSKNGVLLNGERIDAQTDSSWLPGDTVRLGQTELALEDPVTATLSELEAAPDEVVEGPVDPPANELEGDQPAPAGAEARSAVRVAEVPTKGATSAPKPAPRREASPPRETTWGTPDVLIVLLALLVLSLSVGGLLWLLGA